MEFSVIYDLLAPKKIDPYREKLKESEDGNLAKWEHDDKEIFEKTLNEEQKKLFKKYLHSLSLFEEYIDYQVEMRAMNWGIKIGAQLQKSIKDLYRYFDEINDYE